MDNIIKNDRVKIRIIKLLKNGESLSPSMLASKLDYKYETVTKALFFLEKIGVVTKLVTNHGNKKYQYFKLTKFRIST